MTAPQVEKPKEEEKFVTIFYHEARMLTYPGHSYHQDKETGKIMYKGHDGKFYDPMVMQGRRAQNASGMLLISPGENVLPLAVWEDMKKHAVIAQLIEENKLEEFDPAIIKGKTAPPTPGMADDLEAYSYKDAIKLIAETMSLEKLTKWRSNLNPKRDKVDQLKDALTQQLQKLTV